MYNQHILDILIPVYNAEPFLKRCLNSIVSQEEFGKYVRIIVVNDGSSDSSLEILHSFQESYHQIHVISRENKGVGATRNELINLADSKYIWFVDSDDYVSQNSLSIVLPYLRSGEYDMLFMGFIWETDKKKEKRGSHDCTFNSAMDMIDAGVGVYSNALWTRIYRTSIVKESHIHFPSYQMGEDFDFNFKMIRHIAKVKCLKEALYHYVVNSTSAVNLPSMSHMISSSNDSLDCLENNFSYLFQFEEQEQRILKKPLNHFLMGYLYSVFVVPFSLKYKKEAFARLVKMGALPIKPLPADKKKKRFSRILNNRLLRYCAIYCNVLYLKANNGKQ